MGDFIIFLFLPSYIKSNRNTNPCLSCRIIRIDVQNAIINYYHFPTNNKVYRVLFCWILIYLILFGLHLFLHTLSPLYFAWRQYMNYEATNWLINIFRLEERLESIHICYFEGGYKLYKIMFNNNQIQWLFNFSYTKSKLYHHRSWNVLCLI